MLGQKPDIAHLKVVGSKVWVLISKSSRKDKYRPKTVVYRLINYEEIHRNGPPNTDTNSNWEASNANNEPRRYPQRCTIPFWKAKKNLIHINELPESSLTEDTPIIHILEANSTLESSKILEEAL